MTDYNVLATNTHEDRKGFLEARKGKVGCSDLPALCGISTWTSPLDLWMRVTGRTESTEDNDTLWFGRQVEPIILGLLERRLQVPVKRVNEVWSNSKYPLLVGSPDAIVEKEGEEGPGLAEAKNTGLWAKNLWSATSAPDAAHLQLQGQLGVSGYKWGYCAGLIGGSPRDFYTPRFDFSQDIFDQAYERVESFMQLVKKDIPPEARAGDEETLRALHGFPRDRIIDLPDETLELILRHDALTRERAEHNRRSKDVSEQMDDIEAKLQQKLKDSYAGQVAGRLVMLVQQRRKEYTVQASERWVLKIKEIK